MYQVQRIGHSIMSIGLTVLGLTLGVMDHYVIFGFLIPFIILSWITLEMYSDDNGEEVGGWAIVAETNDLKNSVIWYRSQDKKVAERHYQTAINDGEIKAIHGRIALMSIMKETDWRLMDASSNVLERQGRIS